MFAETLFVLAADDGELVEDIFDRLAGSREERLKLWCWLPLPGRGTEEADE